MEERLNNPLYLKSLEIWKRFLLGKITAKDMEKELLGINSEVESLKEMFGGKEI